MVIFLGIMAIHILTDGELQLRKYVEDVSKAADLTNSLFFRPPFGRMKIGQYRKLKEKYRIVLWDIMPYDFDKNFGSERSLQVLKKKIRPGSIIVLHDKASSTANKIISEFINYAIGLVIGLN